MATTTSPPAAPARTVLVSTPLCRQLGAELAQALPPGMAVLEFTVGRVYGAAEIASIEIAFMSSDVVGVSSRTVATPEMEAFCALLGQAQRLQWLQLSSAGVDRPIFQQLATRGVRITTATGAASETVALTAITGLLALSRRMPLWTANQRAHAWLPLRSGELEPRELRGQRVLIVGTGRIGMEIARLCKAFGLVTHGLRHRGPAPLANFDHVDGTDALPEAAGAADWVIAACPQTRETTHLFNRQVFERFKSTANFINIARGGVVDEAALVEALRQKRFEGAYLDVFEVEPLPASSPLWDTPNVILSAHSAGDTTGRHARIASIFLDNLPRYAGGSALVNEIATSLTLPATT